MKKPILLLSVVLGVAGAAYLTGSAAAQNKRQPVPIAPASIGLVDLEYVFKNYKRFVNQSERMQTEFKQKRDELTQLDERIKQLELERKKFNVASDEYERRDNEITRLRADLRAQAEQAEKDFARRDAAMLQKTFQDIQAMIRQTAEAKKLTMVLQTHGTRTDAAATPAEIRRDLNRFVLYNESSIDITKFVVFNLNRWYDSAVSGTKPNRTPSNTRSAQRTPRNQSRKR